MTNLNHCENRDKINIFSSMVDEDWKKHLIKQNKSYKTNLNDIPPKYLYNLSKKYDNINVPTTCFENIKLVK